MTDPAPQRSGDLGNWITFVLLGLFWGTSYLFIKIGVDEGLPTFALIAGRLGIGALLLGTVVAARRVRLPRERATYGMLFTLAIVNVVVPFTLITWGERSIESALASILNATVPLFTIVLAAFFLHDEPISVNKLVGLLIGFVGVIVVTSRSLLGGGASNALGELAMIASSLSYALGNVYARRNTRGLDPLVPAFFQVFFSFFVTAGLALVVDRPWELTITPRATFAVAWLGIFGSGLAYLTFYRLLSVWGSTRTSLVAYVLPVVGITGGFLVLGETLDARIVLGTVLIVGGVLLVNSRYGRRRLFGRGAG